MKKWKGVFLQYADCILLYLSALFLYIYTAPPSVFLGDSGDLTSAAALFGVAHDPGYPLFSFLGYIFQKVFVFGTIAWRMNAFSAIWAAGAVVLVYAIVKYISKNYVAAFVAAACFAVSSTFWLFGITTEVFSLHIFLSLLFLYSLIRFYSEKHRKYLFIAALAFSFQVAHQHMIVLWVPGAMILLFGSKFWQFIKIRDILIAVGIVFSGFLWYAYLPVSQMISGKYYWRDATSLSNILDIFLRKSYGTFDIQKGGSAITDTERVQYLPVYGLLMLFNFSVGGVFLAAIGVLHGLRSRTLITLALLTNFLVSGLVFLAYAGLQLAGLFRLGMIEKFSVMSFSIVAICIGLGVDWLVSNERIQSVFSKSTSILYVRIISVFVLLLPLYLLLAHWNSLNLREYRGGWAVAVDMVFNVPANAIVSVVSDTMAFNARYIIGVEGYRDDVIFVSSPYPPVYADLEKYVDERGLETPYDAANPLFVQSIVDNNIDEVPFLVRSRPARSPEGTMFHPAGMTMQLYQVDTFDAQDQIRKLRHFLNNSFFLNSVYTQDETLPAYARSINYDYSTTVANIGWFFIAYGDAEEAIPVFELGLDLDQANVSNYVGLSFVYRKQGKCDMALNLLESYPNTDNSLNHDILREMYSVYDMCVKDSEQAENIRVLIEEHFGTSE